MIYNITAATGQLGSKIVEAPLKVIKPEDLYNFINREYRSKLHD